MPKTRRIAIQLLVTAFIFALGAAIYFARISKNARAESADLFYYVCWYKYDLSEMLMRYELKKSEPDVERIKISDVWRSALLDDLKLGATVYHYHPSFNQLIWLLNRDARKYNQKLPDWAIHASLGVSQEGAFSKPQYLLPASSVFNRHNQSANIEHQIITPMSRLPNQEN